MRVLINNGENKNPNLSGGWKSDCPLNLMTNWPTISSSLQSSAMSLLQHCGGISAHSSLHNRCNSATLELFLSMKLPIHVMPEHLDRIQFRTWTRPLRSRHFYFQPFRGGLAAVFWILLQTQSLFQCQVRWLDIRASQLFWPWLKSWLLKWLFVHFKTILIQPNSTIANYHHNLISIHPAW